LESRETLIARLRTAAANGASVRSLVDILVNELGAEVRPTFAVMYFFMEAFGLSVVEVQELPFAKCLGGGGHDDDALEAALRPAIQRSRYYGTGLRH
jgi:hypothetical protein